MRIAVVYQPVSPFIEESYDGCQNSFLSVVKNLEQRNLQPMCILQGRSGISKLSSGNRWSRGETQFSFLGSAEWKNNQRIMTAQCPVRQAAQFPLSTDTGRPKSSSKLPVPVKLAPPMLPKWIARGGIIQAITVGESLSCRNISSAMLWWFMRLWGLAAHFAALLRDSSRGSQTSCLQHYMNRIGGD